jgi:DNA-binding LacI/PurR family transcriptional regulator
VFAPFESVSCAINPPVRALQRAIAEHDESIPYTLALKIYTPGRLSELAGLIDDDSLQGAIFIGLHTDDVAFLASADLPFVSVLVGAGLPWYSWVKEAAGSGRLAACELATLERHCPAVLRPESMDTEASGRFASFRAAAIETSGNKPVEIVADHTDEGSGTRAVLECFQNDPTIDGIFAVHDSLAIGAYHALDLLKLRIPDDVAVIGVGDSTAAAYLNPPLSTIGVSYSCVYEEAVKSLFTILSDRWKDPIQEELPIEVALRMSTGHSNSGCAL